MGDLRANNQTPKYHLEYTGIMPFGRYKGEKVKNVMFYHTSYLKWALLKGIVTLGSVVKEAVENYTYPKKGDSHADDYERYAEWL